MITTLVARTEVPRRDAVFGNVVVNVFIESQLFMCLVPRVVVVVVLRFGNECFSFSLRYEDDANHRNGGRRLCEEIYF